MTNYIGVIAHNGKWRAYGSSYGTNYLGTFADPISAAFVRDQFARTYSTRKTKLNNLTDRRTFHQQVANDRRGMYQHPQPYTPRTRNEVVRNWIASANAARRRKTSERDNQLLPQLLEWERDGKAMAWMARQLNVPYNRLRSIIVRYYERITPNAATATQSALHRA